MSKTPGWFDKLLKYFGDAIVVHDDDMTAMKRANRFIRWWLEQVRNLLVVSAFYFLAQRSNSQLLKVLAAITSLLFVLYIGAWQNTFSIRFFPYIKNARVNFWLNMILWLAVVMPIWFTVVVALARVISAITKLPAELSN